MINLEEAIKYTKKKKKEQLDKLGKMKTEDSIKDLAEYLSGKKHVTSVSLKFENLSTWYHWKFISDYINEGVVDYKNLAESSKYFILALDWHIALGQIFPSYENVIPQNKITNHLAQLMILGWKDEVTKMGDTLLNMLYSKYLKGGNSNKKHSWFIIELYCKLANIKLEKEKLNYPKSLDIYDASLSLLSTNSSEVLNSLVNSLSDYHIINSDENAKMDRFNNESSAEFDSSDYFIFPVEILAFLYLRMKSDFQLNDHFEHPLMQLEIAKFPSEQLPKPKIEKLVEDCILKLKNDFLQYE